MSMNKTILSVFGTRPEAIKMAPLLKLLDKSEAIESLVCVTAQHRHMLDQVMNLFDIKPDFDLDIMQPGQNLFDITCNVMLKFKSILERVKPDIVLVHGDTTTTMAASLASYYNKIKVGHVEAGLRTYNKYSPFPEEINRRITGVVTDMHFAPTQIAKDNLIKERIPEKSIYITGNTVIDSLLYISNMIDCNSTTMKELEEQFKFIDKHKKLILVTGHRRENFGGGFDNICNALYRVANDRSDTVIVYPVHFNPNVRETVFNILGDKVNNDIYLIEPLDYLPFVYLMKRSYIILTDSGGVQEEAPSLGKPVLVMRDTTERPEAIEAGTVKLVGTSKERIYKSIIELLDNDELYCAMASAHNPYGDGLAAQRIINILQNTNI